MSANTGLTHEKETQMRWEQPHEERGRHRQNYLHYGHGAVLGPVRPQEPPGSARPSPAGAPPAAALSAQHSRFLSWNWCPGSCSFSAVEEEDEELRVGPKCL